MTISKPTETLLTDRRPTRAEAEAAVRTLLRWAGDDPDREGLKEDAVAGYASL